MGGYNHFGQIADELAGKGGMMLEAFQMLWVEGAQHDAPVDKGDLQGSVAPAPGHTPWERRVIVTSDHALPQEYGSVAHLIVAKNAKVLTDGANFFGPIVHHPGNPEHPFMRPQRLKLSAPFQLALRKLLGG